MYFKRIYLWLLIATSIFPEVAFSGPIPSSLIRHTLLSHPKRDVSQKIKRAPPLPHSSSPNPPSRPTREQDKSQRLTGSAYHDPSPQLPYPETLPEASKVLDKLFPYPRTRTGTGTEDLNYQASLLYRKYWMSASRKIKSGHWDDDKKAQWMKAAQEESAVLRNKRASSGITTGLGRYGKQLYKPGEIIPTRDNIDSIPLMTTDKQVGSFLSLVFNGPGRVGGADTREGGARRGAYKFAKKKIDNGSWTLQEQRAWMREAYSIKDGLSNSPPRRPGSDTEMDLDPPILNQFPQPHQGTHPGQPFSQPPHGEASYPPINMALSPLERELSLPENIIGVQQLHRDGFRKVQDIITGEVYWRGKYGEKYFKEGGAKKVEDIDGQVYPIHPSGAHFLDL